jgi:hypothetical protein
MEIFKHLRFSTKYIDPGEFAIIINDANIVFLATKIVNRRTLNI